MKIKANVLFKNKDDGGLHKDGMSGMQCSFAVKNDLIMCKVISLDGIDIFKLGCAYDVILDLPYGEKFLDIIEENYKFTLQIGSLKFAEGVFKSVDKI